MNQKYENSSLMRVKALITMLDDIIWIFVNNNFGDFKDIKRGDGFETAFFKLSVHASEQSNTSKLYCFFSRDYPFHRRFDLIQIELYRQVLVEYCRFVTDHLEQLDYRIQSGEFLEYSQNSYREAGQFHAERLKPKVAYILEQLKWQATSNRGYKRGSIDMNVLCPLQIDLARHQPDLFNEVRELRGGKGASELADLIQNRIFSNSVIKPDTIVQELVPSIKESTEALIQAGLNRVQQRKQIEQPHLNNVAQLQANLVTKTQEEQALIDRLTVVQNEKKDLETTLTTLTNKVTIITQERDQALLNSQVSGYMQADFQRW